MIVDMDDGEGVRNAVSNRTGLLDALTEDPQTKPELVDQLDNSRSTIDRAVDELLEMDLIAPTSPAAHTYGLTQHGRLALDAYLAYCSETDSLGSNRSLLNTLSPDVALSRKFVADATIHRSSNSPDAALQPGTEILEESTTLRGAAPVVSSGYVDTIGSWVQREETTLELVLERDLMETMKQSFANDLKDVLRLDSVEFRIIDEDLPYSIWLMDQPTTTYAGITIYEGGGVRGSLVAEGDRAVEWAESEYESYYEDAEPLTLQKLGQQ